MILSVKKDMDPPVSPGCKPESCGCSVALGLDVSLYPDGHHDVLS